MASQLKDLSKFSEDALAVALNGLTDEEWQSFQGCMNKLTETLGEKQERKKSAKKITEDEAFREYILPQIMKRVSFIENEECRGLKMDNIDIDFPTNYVNFSDENLLKQHVMIVETEAKLQVLTIFVQFSRGLLYLELNSRLQAKRKTMAEYVRSGYVPVAYTTVLRYMTLATILSSYPRLILCELSMSQILLHRKRLEKHLESRQGNSLKARLSVALEIKIMGKEVKIMKMDITRPEIKFNVAADWIYHDQHDTPNVSDSAMAKWVPQHGEDEDADLEKGLGIENIHL